MFTAVLALSLPLLLLLSPPLLAESPDCLSVYRSGGAAAVFDSPKCPRWTLPPPSSHLRRPSPSRCQVSLLQGRRPFQEDRALCALDIKIPFLGRAGVREIDVGIVAVFDGHNGAEASDMASKLLLDYFLLHTYFLLDVTYYMALKKPSVLSLGSVESRMVDFDEEDGLNEFGRERMSWISPVISDGAFHLEILKESLLRTILDIDAKFSKEALINNLMSGSTATAVLLADGQILAANVGDSKSLLCSKKLHISNEKGSGSKMNTRTDNGGISPTGTYASFQETRFDGQIFYAKELTRDHHPDRDDERRRVEAAGGYVLNRAGVHRVNGELALSRAIGDIPFKGYGVISTPEVTDWRLVSTDDSYLVVASDGVFEKLTTDGVCHLLWHEEVRNNIKLEVQNPVKLPLADSIVEAAYRKGTVDNMAAVVVPMGFRDSSEFFIKDECDQEVTSDFSFRLQMASLYGESASNNTCTSLMPMQYYDQILVKLNRLLVETQHKSLGCFYLSENLNEDVDYVFQAPVDYGKDEIHELHPFQESVGSYSSTGHLDLYKDRQLCWHFGVHEGDKGQCTSPENFGKFLGLLDSIPDSEMTTNSSGSSGDIPHFRYVLKKRFDRGSYGEVWLAFNWNCSEDDKPLLATFKNFTCSGCDLHHNLDGCTMNFTDSSRRRCFDDSDDANLFILKRIMVERGNAAYLSGLREKYFGEVFLNASTAQALSTRLQTVFSMETPDFTDELQRNISHLDEVDFTRTFYGNHQPRVNHEEGLTHIARFVEYFESKSKEIWLVFRNEGVSLSKLLYSAEATTAVTGDDRNARNIHVLHPSAWWYWLRTTEEGATEIQNIIRQLLLALKSCHDRNITHRDIKPENMIVCFEDVHSGRCSREIPSGREGYHLKVRIIDFGSAIDDFTLNNLYGSGPTRSEQTFEYTPPEALLNASWVQGPKVLRSKYDMWSVGVVMLELIIGSPHIFQISDRTRALLDRHLEGWSEQTKELAYKLRAYMEMCILIPGVTSRHHHTNQHVNHGGVWLASWKCSEESFSRQVKSRDPLKLGFKNIWALRLVRQLLLWHPEDRLSVDDALRHPYFQ